MKKSSMSPRKGWLGCTTRKESVASASDVLAITIGDYPGCTADWVVIFVTELPHKDYEVTLKRAINRRYNAGEFELLKNAPASKRYFRFIDLI